MTANFGDKSITFLKEQLVATPNRQLSPISESNISYAQIFGLEKKRKADVQKTQLQRVLHSYCWPALRQLIKQ